MGEIETGVKQQRKTPGTKSTDVKLGDYFLASHRYDILLLLSARDMSIRSCVEGKNLLLDRRIVVSKGRMQFCFPRCVQEEDAPPNCQTMSKEEEAGKEEPSHALL